MTIIWLRRFQGISEPDLRAKFEDFSGQTFGGASEGLEVGMEDSEARSF